MIHTIILKSKKNSPTIQSLTFVTLLPILNANDAGSEPDRSSSHHLAGVRRRVGCTSSKLWNQWSVAQEVGVVAGRGGPTPRDARMEPAGGRVRAGLACPRPANGVMDRADSDGGGPRRWPVATNQSFTAPRRVGAPVTTTDVMTDLTGRAGNQCEEKTASFVYAQPINDQLAATSILLQ